MDSSLAIANSDIALAVFLRQEHDSACHLIAYSKSIPLAGWQAVGAFMWKSIFLELNLVPTSGVAHWRQTSDLSGQNDIGEDDTHKIPRTGFSIR